MGRILPFHISTWTILGSICKDPVPKLAESLELIEEFVHNIKCPFRKEEECITHWALHFGLGDEFVEKSLVHFPSLHAIPPVGAGDGVEMPQGEFLVDGEEEGVASAFVRNCLGRWPRTLFKVLDLLREESTMVRNRTVAM
jgi:hypothetical protein